jgi:hypothetical protein
MPIVTDLRYHPYTMKFLPQSRFFDKPIEATPVLVVGDLTTMEDQESEEQESTAIKTIGWITAGMGAVALGLFLGRELRQRYKFNRRTPYDIYSHAGDEQDVDFGLGI